jgi:hypothetical protein
MDHFIRCKVFPGQFSSEFAVHSTQSNGEMFSLFVPTSCVAPDEPPTRDHYVDGWLQVSLWELNGNQAVVRLPRESFESGRFVTVDLSQFKEQPQRPEPVEA